METIWLACCSCEAYPQIQREVAARSPQAKIMRVDGAASLATVVLAFAQAEIEVGVAVAASGARVLEALEALPRDTPACQVIALCPETDAALAARLFQAGATEVIAGARALPDDSEEEERAETERVAGAPARPRACDEEALGAPHGDMRMASPSEEAVAEAVPRALAGAGSFADDLDEPERTGVAEAVVAEVMPRRERATRCEDVPSTEEGAPAAPLVTLISGRGGCGKTTLAGAMALRASARGLRCALIDLDLMFGNLYALLGVEEPRDAAPLAAAVSLGALTEGELVRASMRVGPGLTLWGPVQAPEQAELMGPVVDELIPLLRREADLIIVDTSVTWTDAVAAAVAACDRCLVVGDDRVGATAAAERAIDLAARIGVSRTKMVSVFNRCSSREGAEDAAARFEFTTALGMKARIDEGGSDLPGLAAVGRLDRVLAQPGAFQASACAFTDTLLGELGCVGAADDAPAAPAEPRVRIRLPWKRGGGWES